VRNPNVRILMIALALILCVAAIGLFISPPKTAADDAGVQAFLRIQVDDEVWEPIPLMDDGVYTINQPDGKTNVVFTTATGAVMHSSTCDNQSCVKQGEVTLENRESRVLTNMIICLPNQVILEVLTPEEAGMEAVQ